MRGFWIIGFCVGALGCGGATWSTPTASESIAVPRESSPSRAGRAEAPLPVPRAPGPPTLVDADADGDGVPDARDVCPRAPGADDENPAWAGCPFDAPPRPTPPATPLVIAIQHGDRLRPLEGTEIGNIREIGEPLGKDPRVTLLTRARTRELARAWNRRVARPLIEGGVDPRKLGADVCVVPNQVALTIVSSDEISCADFAAYP